MATFAVNFLAVLGKARSIELANICLQRVVRIGF
jgi:hypothetical protein